MTQRFKKTSRRSKQNVGTFKKKRLDALDAGNVGTLSKSIEKSYKIFGL